MTNRWFYRCLDCLRVVATTEPLEWSPYPYRPPAACAVCGGDMEEMGRVEPCGRLGRLETRCACDSRCTHAAGPNCECRCGGENHGTGRVVEVVRDAGPVPRLAAAADDADARLAARAAEWRTRMAEANAAFEPLVAERSSGAWMPTDRFNRYRQASTQIFLARSGRVHATRMKHLDRAIQICQSAAAV